MQGRDITINPLKLIAKNPKQSTHNLALKTSARTRLSAAIVIDPKKRDVGILDICTVKVEPSQNRSIVP